MGENVKLKKIQMENLLRVYYINNDVILIIFVLIKPLTTNN